MNRSRNAKRSRDPSLDTSGAANISKWKKRLGTGSKSIDDGTLLVETLKTHGLFLQSGDNPHLLNTDQAAFLKSFTKDVSTHVYFPNNIDEMLTTLFEYLENKVFLRTSLGPTKTSPDCDNARSDFQDSLIRLLLCVPDMQKKLIEHLLDILKDLSSTNQDIPITQRSQATVVPLPHLILSSIRFLPLLKDGHAVVDKLLDILTTASCPLDVQKEIIFSLPHTVSDAQHEKIGVALKDILCESRALTCSILDTLTSISISRGIMQDIVNTVLKRLDRIDLDDLPSAVEFVLSSIQGPDDAITVLQELRENLDLSPPPPAAHNDLRTQNRRKETKDIQCIIMEAIHLQSLISKPMADAWLKIIDSCQEVEFQKSLDIHILIAFADNVTKKKLVENIFKNKIRKGMLTEKLFKEAITNYSSIIKKYFNNFISVCDFLLRSPEVGISHFASFMYIQTFVSFGSSDLYYQQSLVADLIEKVGTGGGGAITDGALRTLVILAEKYSSKLVAYTALVTAILDYTDNMSLGQFRQLMTVLCNLAWFNSGNDEDVNKSSLQNEVNIMMRKQLGSKTLKKRGVIAAVCAVRAMAKQYDRDAEGNDADQSKGNSSRASVGATGGSSSRANKEIEKAVSKLIDSAVRETRLDPEAAGLFMDELASPALIKDLPITIAKTCSERFQTTFEADFVEDYAENKSERSDLILPIKQLFKIEEDETETSESLEEPIEITLPIAKWVLQNKENPLNHRTEVDRFIPHFRLMAAITSFAETDEIDALLGCGILVVPESYLNNEEILNSRELKALTDIIFYSINWFREIVNFFINSEDEMTRKQVLVRIKNILFLEEKLKVHLSVSQNYRPPTVLYSEDTSDWQPINNEKGKKGKSDGKPAAGGKGKGGGKGGKKKGNKNETEALNGTVHLTTQVTQPGGADASSGPVASSTMIGQQSIVKPAQAAGANVDLGHFRPFLRELDLDVLKLFNYYVVSTDPEPGYEQERKDPKLRPADLMFLLKDVAAKVDKKLVGKKKMGFPGLGSSASGCGYTNLMSLDERMVAHCLAIFLPKLFANLDVLKGYFQNLIQINDGIMDCANLYTPDCAVYSQCIKLGLDIATSLFTWNGFQSSDNESILKICLASLVERLEGNVADDLDLPQLAEKTVSYLMTFKDNIVSCEVASSHLGVLDALAKIENSDWVRQQVSLTAGSYAKRNWQTAEGKDKGAVFNAQVTKFWTYFLDYSDQPLQLILDIFNSGIQEVFENKAKDYYNEAYPTVTRATLHTLYQVSLQKLANEIKGKTYGVTKDKDELLIMWTQTTDILLKAVNPLKVWRNRGILKAVLKYSKPVIDYFLKNGMPLFEDVFKRKSKECLNVIKTLQASTRYMHVICTSTKLDSDLALASFVPMLKKSLEATVYRVQAMLAANNYGDAFWLGNLKNRDLAGEEIMSQVPEEDEDEEGEDEMEDNQDENQDEEMEFNGAEDPDSVKYDDDDDD